MYFFLLVLMVVFLFKRQIDSCRRLFDVFSMISDDQPVVGHCVRCGSIAGPLYKRYGKHALRLTQCVIFTF